jgi:hypothetical protein
LFFSCSQKTQTFLQKGGDPVELFRKVNRGLGKLGRWFRCNRLNWRGHIGQVGIKVRQLLGVLGRVIADLDEHLLLSLYNSMVLPHLQYCLMVWGDFEAGRNLAYGETLLKLQKRFVELIAGKGGRYHVC